MIPRFTSGEIYRSLGRFSETACTAILLLAVGCPAVPGGTPSEDNGSGTPSGPGTPADGEITAEIINVNNLVQVSALEVPLSVLYSVSIPEGTDAGGVEVESFYIPASEETRVPISGSLPVGEGQFGFDPTKTGVGTYQVGITVTSGTEQITALSPGFILVEGPPEPRFFLPGGVGEIVQVAPGESVEVTFDAGDPEDDVSWRVFYLAPGVTLSGPADEFGEIVGTVGSGNIGRRVMSTTGLAPGDYQIGISAVDGGDSIATAAGKDDDRIVTVLGPIVRISQAVGLSAPVVSVLAPGPGSVELFGDEGFDIIVSAGVFEPGAIGLVETFYDSDAEFSNGFPATIKALTIPSTGGDDGPTTLDPIPLPAGLPEGTYHIGAFVDDGINSPVVDYASGTITIVRTPRLTVTEPASSLLVRPADAGTAADGVRVSWTTNVPESAGMVDVFARALDNNGTEIGAEIRILAPSSTKTTNAVFFPEASGLFQITVRIILNDNTTAGDCVAGVCVKTAPRTVRASTLPSILWLGSLAQDEPAFDGAIFKGIDREDNSGSSLTPAGDLNGDGLGDFVIAARYGKGRSGQLLGPGEAYLIYGTSGAGRLLGEHDLGLVGTSAIQGVLFTGVEPQAGAKTDGLASVTVIPDVDGDSKGELAFGFPRTDSSCDSGGPLCSPGQFLNGGVVIVSSTNSILNDPTGGTPEIDCGAVGQNFSDETVAVQALEDRLTFDAGSCVAGTDGFPDTVVGQAVEDPSGGDPILISEGFISTLAPSLFPPGFEPIPEGTAENEGICVTQFDAPDCVDASGGVVLGGAVLGSGFYPDGSAALEPLGARILGVTTGGGFGTSVAWSVAEAAGGTDSNSCPSAVNGICEDGDIGAVSNLCELGTDLDDCGQRFRKTGELIISSPNADSKSGTAFMTMNRSLWGEDPAVEGIPPTPYQYLMEASGYCGAGRTPPLAPVRITGDAADNIQNILGIEDFNGDGKNDIAVGVPAADGGQGRLYIVFRDGSESDFALSDIALDPSNLNRVDGLLITSNSPAGLGASVAGGFDFNNDGAADLIVGSPEADNGTGEVIVIFADPDLTSPAGGLSVDTLLGIRNSQGLPRGVRITGNTIDSERGRFGFNVANGGDIDGDGLDDLLIAAPDASPRFDPDPSDGEDVLTALGVDRNLDGIQDDVDGPAGLPDGVSDQNDNLQSAGIVYVIFGSNRLDLISPADPTNPTVGIDQLGAEPLRGFMIAGQRAGDRIGGGDSSELGASGITEGRSHGLSGAGDVDGDGRADLLIGAILADPHPIPDTGVGVENAGAAYLVYGSVAP